MGGSKGGIEVLMKKILNNKQIDVFIKINGKLYAVEHNGKLHEVIGKCDNMFAWIIK